MAFSSRSTLTVVNNLTSPADLDTPASQLSIVRELNFAEGTGANQANRVFRDTRTLTASSTEDLDLAGSALLDAFGVAVVFARVKELYVKAAAANTNNVLLGGVANGWAAFLSPAATGIITLPPGAHIHIGNPSAAGWVVTAGTGDLLHVANSAAGTSVSYDIVIIGSAT